MWNILYIYAGNRKSIQITEDTVTFVKLDVYQWRRGGAWSPQCRSGPVGVLDCKWADESDPLRPPTRLLSAAGTGIAPVQNVTACIRGSRELRLNFNISKLFKNTDSIPKWNTRLQSSYSLHILYTACLYPYIFTSTSATSTLFQLFAYISLNITFKALLMQHWYSLLLYRVSYTYREAA